MLNVQKALKGVLTDYYKNLTSPVAWCTSAGPAEILRALGFKVYFPENHGAMLGASRTAERYIPRAHQMGYHGEICSYLTSDIGAWMMDETPLTKAYGLESVPKPDLIVFNTNQCREVSEWFNFYGEKYNCPVFGIFPPRYVEEILPEHLDDVSAQFEQLIKLGESVIGKTMTDSAMNEVLELSSKGSSLWKKVLGSTKKHPSPITFFDSTILMAPIVVMRGTRECVDFYTLALRALKFAPPKYAAVPGETIRLYWEGMPIWGRLRKLADFFIENQTAIVASTYCNSWVFDDFDTTDPLKSMAMAYTQIFINRGEKYKLKTMVDIMDDFQVDGVIFHDSKTCFNNSNNRFGLPRKIAETTDYETVTIDGDLVDMRFLSEGQMMTKLETFIEQLKSKKAAIHA